jgi:hypothetical protein
MSKAGKSTFGTPFASYTKVLVPNGRNHYFGKGPACDIGIQSLDLKLLKRNKCG